MVSQRDQEKGLAFIRDRAFLVLGSATVVGIALVGTGWVIEGAAYVPGLLMQLGSSLMLLVPLAILGFMLEGRLRRTEEQVRATAEQLETLTTVTRERLAANRRQRDQMFDTAKRVPSQGRIRALLADAADIGAIDGSGPRVQVPGTELRVRFRPQDGDVLTVVEEADGTPLAQLPWTAGEAADGFAQQLAGVLRKLDRYPGDGAFDPTRILQHLLEMVRLGVESSTGEHPRDLGHLIEVPNEQWAISSEGLYSLQQHYHIPAQRITGSHDDWPRHMRSLAWVDEAAFDEAYLIARQLLRHT